MWPVNVGVVFVPNPSTKVALSAVSRADITEREDLSAQVPYRNVRQIAEAVPGQHAVYGETAYPMEIAKHPLPWLCRNADVIAIACS